MHPVGQTWQGKGMAQYNLAIEFTPSALRNIVDCVPSERFSERHEEDRFNLTEMVAHLADWEVLFLDRMTLANEQPGVAVEAIDETQRAIDKHYSTRDIQHELDVFENRRRDTLTFLRALAPEDWTKTFIHSERGEMTIADQVTMLLGHDLYHLEQASAYLRS